MKLELEVNEIQFLINVLNELPTKSGAYVLVQKIVKQVESEQQAE